MMGIKIPYESTGRRTQKSRTRAALVDATRGLLARGLLPTVEEDVWYPFRRSDQSVDNSN